MSFVERLKILRKEKALTQQQMADLLHIPKNTYIKYERGVREPRLAQLTDMAGNLNVPLGYLLGDSNEQSRGISIGKVSIEAILQNPEFFNEFGKYGQALRDMMGAYISQILGLEFGNVDLFYMQLMIVEEFENIYNTGRLYFLNSSPEAHQYKAFIDAAQNFRKKIDDFLCLLQSSDFYEENGHFKNDVLTYKYDPFRSNKEKNE